MVYFLINLLARRVELPATANPCIEPLGVHFLDFATTALL